MTTEHTDRDRRPVRPEPLGKAGDALAASHAAIPLDGRRIDLIGIPVISANGGNGRFGPLLSAVPAGELKVVGDRTEPQSRLVF
ncbi:hypothetical protein ACFCY9_35145 [Streptomyces fimicarius]|uniref:hypothetical protein n=1 Tax=Streptomyces griseus TaxID=1911 RepID=UPI0035DEFEF6